MMRAPLRPWGLASTILPRLSVKKWDVLGCLGAEDRSITTFTTLKANNGLRSAQLWRIASESTRYALERQKRLLATMAVFEDAGGLPVDLREHSLLERADLIYAGFEEYLSTAEALMLDISAFPKRFFFPFVRWCLESSKEDIVVAYTVAAAYAGGSLSEDVEPVGNLPAFMGTPDRAEDALVIALGFQPLGISDMLGSAGGAIPVHLLFPYPAHPIELRRVWAFVDSVKQAVPTATTSPIFVSPLDASDIVDHLVHRLSGNGARHLTLAPYGPKPISLGMAIAASAHQWPVLYTQPKTYHPAYSAGVKMISGAPATYIYPLRIRGRNIYAI